MVFIGTQPPSFAYMLSMAAVKMTKLSNRDRDCMAHILWFITGKVRQPGFWGLEKL